MSGAAFKNKLEKIENSNKLARHRAMLHDIARSTQREYIAKEPFKKMLRSNSKGEYIKQVRQNEIDLENMKLLEKIVSIKNSPPKARVSQDMNYSHSLNKIIRQKSFRSIKDENSKMRKRIINQKPSFSFEKCSIEARKHKRWLSNFSKAEKYLLPDLNKSGYSQSQDTIGYGRSEKRYGLKLNLDYHDNPQEIPFEFENWWNNFNEGNKDRRFL